MKGKSLFISIMLLGASFSLHAQNWFQVTSGTQKKLNTIHFPSSNIGYIGGNDSLFLKTMDGGKTWNHVTYTGVDFLPGGEHILNLQFVSDNIGFMSIGPYSGTYKTTDGGATWTLEITNTNQCFNQGLYFFDQNNGFIGGSGCFQGEVISQLNAGVWSGSNINASTNASENYIVDIDFYNNNYGLAASKSGYFFRTTDGGQNWDSIPSPDLQNPLTAVLIINDTLAFGAYESANLGFGLYVSTDAGLTWNQDMNSATFYYPNFYTLHQSGDGHIFTGGISQNMQGLIFENAGDFTNWNYSVVDQKINDISSINDSIVFAVGDSGYIVVNKLLPGMGISEIANESMEFAVFPNPANSVLNIELNKKSDSKNATIQVYNLNGSIIKSSIFRPVIDVSDLSNGLYILEIRINEKKLQKKLLVQRKE